MPFAYYDRLSPARQRTYRRSDEIGTLSLPAGVAAGADIARVRDALAREDAAAVRAGSPRLIDALVAGFGVPPIRVRAAGGGRHEPARRRTRVRSDGDGGGYQLRCWSNSKAGAGGSGGSNTGSSSASVASHRGGPRAGAILALGSRHPI